MVTEDALTPRILDAEQAVLGSMLIEESLVGPVIAEVEDSDFTFSLYRTIFQAMKQLFRAGEVVDPVTVCNKLGSDDSIRTTVLQLMEITPTAASIWAYVPIMKEQARLWRLKELGAKLHDAQHMDDAKTILAEMNKCLVMKSKVKRYSAQDVLLIFADRHAEGNHPDYIPWGLAKVDDQVCAERGDFVIIGGTPSSGKTALAIQFAWHMSTSRRVGFYSLETNEVKLADRSVSGLAEIHMGDIKRSKLTMEQWNRFAGLGDRIGQCQIDFIPAAGFTVDDIEADALANRYDVIFIDYLQLIRVPGRFYNRTEAVTDISIDLHRISQGRGITVVALSQLSRESYQEKSPSMYHLRESGQLEQDADIIMLLYRNPTNEAPNLRGLKIAKNKDGPIGEVFLDFDGTVQTFKPSDINPRKPKMASHLYNEGRKAQIRNRSQVAMAGFQEINVADEDLPF